VDYALDIGYKNFLLLGCTNGRLDHTLANICLLERLSARGAFGTIADDKNVCLLHAGGRMALNKKPGYKYLSVLAIDEQITGITLTGFKYALTNGAIRRDEPIGVSNEFKEDEAVIDIRGGRALIIYSRD